jgi:hypothetical protein
MRATARWEPDLLETGKVRLLRFPGASLPTTREGVILLDTTALGGLLVAGLTELLGFLSGFLNTHLGSTTKHALSILLSAGVVMVQFPGHDALSTAGNGVLVYVVSKLTHDIGLSETGGLSGKGVGK